MSTFNDNRSSQMQGLNDSDGEFTGVVKWFCNKRDFGFVVCNSSGNDALLHGNVLRSFGHRSIVAGTEVSALYRERDNGLQLTEVLGISIPDNLDDGNAPHTPIQKFDAAQYSPARVKWYDEVRGFGFVNLYRQDTDFFLHAAQLLEAGMGNVSDGEALSVIVGNGEKGPAVLAVDHWQSAAVDR